MAKKKSLEKIGAIIIWLNTVNINLTGPANPREKIPVKKIIEVVAAVVIISGVFSAGFLVGQQAKTVSAPSLSLFGIINIEKDKPEEVDFSQFWQSWGAIRKYYVDRTKLDNQQMVYGAIEGLVKSLGDPYTAFLKPQEAQTFSEDVQGQFSGIGIEIGQRKGILTVIAPLENTPAKLAGLQAGDKIIKINDTDTQDMTTEEAVHLIRGPVGTDVTLSILREGWTEPKDFKITRALIIVPTVSWKLIDDKIAHIQLNSFTAQMESEFGRVVNEMLNSPAQALILDLRNNPGGYLDQAVKIAGWFLKSGDVVLLEDEGSGATICADCRASGNGRLASFPTVILVNKGSASASEILAGALHDQLGIKMIGEKTFGKGSVQTVQNFRDGSALKITVAKWLTPKGRSIAEEGLAPDITIELTGKDSEAGRDPQLDKATEMLKGGI